MPRAAEGGALLGVRVCANAKAVAMGVVRLWVREGVRRLGYRGWVVEFDTCAGARLRRSEYRGYAGAVGAVFMELRVNGLQRVVRCSGYRGWASVVGLGTADGALLRVRWMQRVMRWAGAAVGARAPLTPVLCLPSVRRRRRRVFRLAR